MITCPVCNSTSARPSEKYKEYVIHHCESCDVEFADPMKSPGKEWYENHTIYRNRYQSVGQYIGWMHREFLRLTPGAGKRLLDVGCGTGDFVIEAERYGFDSIGLDFDAQAIAVGTSHWKTNRLHNLSIDDFFFRNKQHFDAITFFEVLEHLEQPLEFLRDLKKYLHPGGHISFSVPNRDSTLNSLYRKLVPDIDYPPHHLTRWSKRAVEDFLKREGFSLECLKTAAPTVSDQVFDVLRTRLSWLPHRFQRLLAIAGALLLRPIDLVLIHGTSQEGRGMIIIAKLL